MFYRYCYCYFCLLLLLIFNFLCILDPICGNFMGDLCHCRPYLSLSGLDVTKSPGQKKKKKINRKKSFFFRKEPFNLSNLWFCMLCSTLCRPRYLAKMHMKMLIKMHIKMRIKIQIKMHNAHQLI